MTRDEARKMCIEAIAEEERKLLEGAASSVEGITKHLLREPVNAKSADWLNGQEVGWKQALSYAARTLCMIAKDVNATAAFDSLNGIARVVPDDWLCGIDYECCAIDSQRADLTNPPEKKP